MIKDKQQLELFKVSEWKIPSVINYTNLIKEIVLDMEKKLNLPKAKWIVSCLWGDYISSYQFWHFTSAECKKGRDKWYLRFIIPRFLLEATYSKIETILHERLHIIDDKNTHPDSKDFAKKVKRHFYEYFPKMDAKLYYLLSKHFDIIKLTYHGTLGKMITRQLQIDELYEDISVERWRNGILNAYPNLDISSLFDDY